MTISLPSEVEIGVEEHCELMECEMLGRREERATEGREPMAHGDDGLGD